MKLMNSITRTFNRAGLKLRKHGPTIGVIGGTIGVVIAGVIACRETLKLEEVLEPTKDSLDDIREYVEEHGHSEEYTEQDEKRDIVATYLKGAGCVVKLYAPSLVLGSMSVASILMSHKTMSNRNATLVAACTAVGTAFKDYRTRVVEEFGEETDKMFKYGLKKKEIEETVVDEKGKEKTVKKTVMVSDDETRDRILNSPFSKFFDESCNGWTKDPELNKTLLIRQQAWANDKLAAQGHMFLNEVYDMLGIPRTSAGQKYGWIYEKDIVNKIDFGIYVNTRDNRRFVNGYERTVLLDFNVDPVPIIDEI